MTESKKADFEKDYLVVESDYFKDVIYAVYRDGRGMHVVVGNKSIAVCADQVMPLAAEICAVWDNMRPRMVR